MTAPSRQEVLAQQERKSEAQAVEAKAQIDREAALQTLTAPVAPEQRSDTSGDMFSMEKAQAEIDNRNAGVAVKADPNQGGFGFDDAPLFSRSGKSPAKPELFRAPEVRNAQGKLLAPNGKPLKLNEGQWHQVRSPAFKKWFGDWVDKPVAASKAADPATGEPIVVYHGTNSDFSVFQMFSASLCVLCASAVSAHLFPCSMRNISYPNPKDSQC